MADSGYKNISRMDARRNRPGGWYVRVSFKKKMYAKFFSNVTYGGSEEALQEAIQYRDQLEKEIGKPRTERTVIGCLHRRNNTGVAGVRRTQKIQEKRGRKYIWDVYEVTWSLKPDRVCRTAVSIKKYGEQEAFRRACAIRAAKEAEIYKEAT
jgi:hypothetical protein